VAVPFAATGEGDWVGTLTERGTTVKEGVAVAVVTTVKEHAISVYSVAVIVNVPPVDAAVTDAPVNDAAPPDTKTQSLLGAVKVAPLGSPDALNVT
jgi:hypothetical protein